MRCSRERIKCTMFLQLAPPIGAAVAHAAAYAEVRRLQAGLIFLDQIEEQSAVSFQPYWAVRAHLFLLLKPEHDAAEAFDRAIGLPEDS
jgi:predicted RNA polymerase sigma factor